MDTIQPAKTTRYEVTDIQEPAYISAEMEDDIAIFDKIKADDDGYRIPLDEFRARYGI